LEDNVKVVIVNSAVTEVIMGETVRTAVPTVVARIAPVALAVMVVTPVVTVSAVTRANSRRRTSQWINLENSPEAVMETMVNETTRIDLVTVVVVQTVVVVVVISRPALVVRHLRVEAVPGADVESIGSSRRSTTVKRRLRVSWRPSTRPPSLTAGIRRRNLRICARP